MQQRGVNNTHTLIFTKRNKGRISQKNELMWVPMGSKLHEQESFLLLLLLNHANVLHNP